MPPSCDHTGTPGLVGFTHFHSSTMSGSALLTIARTRLSVSPRQSPSSRILSSICRDASVLLSIVCASDRPSGFAARSLFGQGSEVTLCLPVPRHSRHRMPPPCLHLPQGRVMGRISARDHLSEVPVL